jgi:hypothetical protein
VNQLEGWNSSPFKVWEFLTVCHHIVNDKKFAVLAWDLGQEVSNIFQRYFILFPIVRLDISFGQLKVFEHPWITLEGQDWHRGENTVDNDCLALGFCVMEFEVVLVILRVQPFGFMECFDSVIFVIKYPDGR